MLSKLNEPPTPLYLDYLQVDYVELLCLVNTDRIISVEDVYDRLLEDGDLNDLNDFEEMGDSRAEKEDDNRQKIESWFRHLRYREEVFGTAYPFRLGASGKYLERHDTLSDLQKAYIFLLLASELRCLSKSDQNKLTSNFEVISVHALKSYLSANAEVHLFGTNPLNHSGHFSQTRKYDRIKKLSETLWEDLKIKQEDFSEHDRGDEGLDIVAWLPTGDNTAGFITIFGQCACGDKWADKQFSSGFDKWNRLIDLSIRPINMIFVPYCFRDLRGKWYHPHELQMTVMFDRLRIIRLLQSISNLPTLFTGEVVDLLEAAISYEESSV